jgi:hypothetical protein
MTSQTDNKDLPPLYGLSEAHEDAILAASLKKSSREEMVTFRTEVSDDGEITLLSNMATEVYSPLMLSDALGGGGEAWTRDLTRDLMNLAGDQPRPRAHNLEAGVSFIQSTAPANEAQAALAGQMFATHRLFMTCAARASQEKTSEAADPAIRQLTELSRLFTWQMDALSNHRRNQNG